MTDAIQNTMAKQHAIEWMKGTMPALTRERFDSFYILLSQQGVADPKKYIAVAAHEMAAIANTPDLLQGVAHFISEDPAYRNIALKYYESGRSAKAMTEVLERGLITDAEQKKKQLEPDEILMLESKMKAVIYALRNGYFLTNKDTARKAAAEMGPLLAYEALIQGRPRSPWTHKVQDEASASPDQTQRQ
jgi:hypothetical protein